MKIYLAGHNGMVGSAIKRKLDAKGFSNLIYKSSSELDLKDQLATNLFIEKEKPDVVIIAAARVGGILANDKYPYQFIYDNIQIQNNLINASHLNDVSKLIFLGSSCIYPRLAEQPLKEDYLLTGSLEPTNQWYAIAKIAGIKMIDSLRIQYGRDYYSLMPTNLFGTNDNFDLNTSHVLPAMIRKFHEAKGNGNTPVHLWGSGTPKREFLYVDDLADAVFFTLKNKLKNSLYNIGTGKDISIKELAFLIKEVIGHSGKIVWDSTKPDGTPRKLMDITKIQDEGWEYSTKLIDGITRTYKWFLENEQNFKEVTITP